MFDAELLRELAWWGAIGYVGSRIITVSALKIKIGNLESRIRRMERDEIARIKAGDIKSHIFPYPLGYEDATNKGHTP